jgi:hypothetical protein
VLVLFDSGVISFCSVRADDGRIDVWFCDGRDVIGNHSVMFDIIFWLSVSFISKLLETKFVSCEKEDLYLRYFLSSVNHSLKFSCWDFVSSSERVLRDLYTLPKLTNYIYIYITYSIILFDVALSLDVLILSLLLLLLSFNTSISCSFGVLLCCCSLL